MLRIAVGGAAVMECLIWGPPCLATLSSFSEIEGDDICWTSSVAKAAAPVFARSARRLLVNDSGVSRERGGSPYGEPDFCRKGWCRFRRNTQARYRVGNRQDWTAVACG